MKTKKLEDTINMIFKKLKDYEYREIFLEKENLKKFINLLLNEN